MGNYREERAKELRALPDEVLVGLELAALDVHADLNETEEEGAGLSFGFVTDGSRGALKRALQATGACDCTPSDGEEGR